MEIGYARVPTTRQDLERQAHALEQVGIEASRIYVDEESRATIDRPGRRAALACARPGDVLVVHALDRLGRTVRDTLDLIHDLAERGVGVKNLADPTKVDPFNPSDPMAQPSVCCWRRSRRWNGPVSEPPTPARWPRPGYRAPARTATWPPRSPEPVTADGEQAEQRGEAGRRDACGCRAEQPSQALRGGRGSIRHLIVQQSLISAGGGAVDGCLASSSC